MDNRTVLPCLVGSFHIKKYQCYVSPKNCSYEFKSFYIFPKLLFSVTKMHLSEGGGRTIWFLPVGRVNSSMEVNNLPWVELFDESNIAELNLKILLAFTYYIMNMQNLTTCI